MNFNRNGWQRFLPPYLETVVRPASENSGMPSGEAQISEQFEPRLLSAAGPPRRGVAADNAERYSFNAGIGIHLAESASPSITHSLTRQEGKPDRPEEIKVKGIAAVDWWTSSGSVKWATAASDVFEILNECRAKSAAAGEPVLLPLGDGLITVQPHGYGSGRKAHFEYVLKWCGVTFAISPRGNSSRQLPNFDLTIPGDPCLQYGFNECRQRILNWIEDWGGEIVDEWTRRLDVCLDLPGIDANAELFPAIERHQYVAVRGKCNLSRVENAYTGVTFGNQTATIVIYDKLAEVQRKQEAYQRALVLNRWGSRWPESATRIEYRVCGKWLKRFGLRAANDAVANLSGIVDQLTTTTGRRFFVVTKDVPDRANRHQDRAEVHPVWQQLVDTFREAMGAPEQPLKKVDRRALALVGYFRQTLGLTLSAAAHSATPIDSANSLVEFIREWIKRNEIADEFIAQKFEKKARDLGTWNDSIAKRSTNHLAA